MKTAWCLAGGGSRGIYQFGMIKRAMEVLGPPDIIIGTSAGSLNAAGVAMGDLAIMEKVWMRVRNSDVRRLAPWNLFVKNKASLFDFEPLRSSMGKFVDKEKLEQSKIEMYATCTSLIANCGVRYRLSGPGCHPDPINVLHASCSPPVLVPPSNGAFYDGGLCDNFNLGFAMTLGAQSIVMFPTCYPGPTRINSVIDVVEAAIGIPIWNAYQREIDGWKCMPDDMRPKLTAIEPAKPAGFSMFDFEYKGVSRSDLIYEGYKLAKKALG